jgi:peptidoglycan hydrolase-like protein with peptidoglycan-binding domain
MSIQRQDGAVAEPAPAVEEGNPSAPPKADTSTHPTVKYGSKGPAVEELQQKLNKDMEKNGGTPLVADGIFGPKTKAAVVAFQKRNNLAPDGIVGPLTWGKIDELGLSSDVGRVEKEWEEVVGGVTYGMTSRYTWRIVGNEIRITVKLKFTGLDRPALVQRWFNHIRATWNRFDAENEKGEKIAVVFEPESVKSGEDNVVEIKAGNGRSDAANWFADDPDSDNTAAHEFGHMVGLEDEYQRSHTDYKRLTGKEPDAGPENAGNADAIAIEMNTALQAPDEPTRVQQANDVITNNNLVQGTFSQQVAAAYEARFGVKLVDHIVDRIPAQDEWSIVDPFTHSGQSIMGLGGNHDHPIEGRHVREFVNYVASSKGGTWKPVER